MLGKYFNKPLVITARGSDITLFPHYRLPRKMIQWAARRADGIITVCNALRDEVVTLGVDAGARDLAAQRRRPAAVPAGRPRRSARAPGPRRLHPAGGRPPGAGQGAGAGDRARCRCCRTCSCSSPATARTAQMLEQLARDAGRGRARDASWAPCRRRSCATITARPTRWCCRPSAKAGPTCCSKRWPAARRSSPAACGARRKWWPRPKRAVLMDERSAQRRGRRGQRAARRLPGPRGDAPLRRALQLGRHDRRPAGPVSQGAWTSRHDRRDDAANSPRPAVPHEQRQRCRRRPRADPHRRRRHRAARRRAQGRLCVVNYHRILRSADPLLESEPDVDTFRWQMRAAGGLLQRAAAARRGDGCCATGRMPPRAVCITFDDGYRSVHDLALPILKEFGLPATVFVTSGYVGERQHVERPHHRGGAEPAERRSSTCGARPGRVFAAQPGRPQGDGGAPDRSVQVPAAASARRADRAARAAGRRRPRARPDADAARWWSTWTARASRSARHTISHPILTSLDDDEARAARSPTASSSWKQIDRQAGAPVRLPERQSRARISTNATRAWRAKPASTPPSPPPSGSITSTQDRFQLPRSRPWDDTRSVSACACCAGCRRAEPCNHDERSCRHAT